MGDCPYCKGTGKQYSGPDIWFICPDCSGRGVIPRCDSCGNPYSEEYCDACYTVCEYCRTIRHIKDEMRDTMCLGCVEAVADARDILHNNGIASYRVTDEQLAEICVLVSSEVSKYLKSVYAETGVHPSGAAVGNKYTDILLRLCTSDDYNCQPYSMVKCGFCGECGVSVDFQGTEEDSDGTFNNWRATCINCGTQSLDMDDPAYAVEVIVNGEYDGVKDAD